MILLKLKLTMLMPMELTRMLKLLTVLSMIVPIHIKLNRIIFQIESRNLL